MSIGGLGPNSVEDTGAFLPYATGQQGDPLRVEFALAALHRL
jgi:hypothetical protein